MAISVIIGTYNSREHLAEAVRSASGFDETLVYDMGSTDGTPDAARALGCRVLELGHPEGDMSLPHNIAIRAAKYEWILMLRSTEIVTPQLRKHLYGFINHPGEIRGLFIPRRNFLMDRERTNAYPDFQLRFFAKEDTLWDANPDAYPRIAGRVERIPARRQELALIHIPSSITAVLDHLGDEYAKAGLSPKRVSLIKIVMSTIGAFLDDYILKGKFRYGASGYIDSFNTAVAYHFMLGKRHEQEALENFHRKVIRPILGSHLETPSPESEIQELDKNDTQIL